MIIMILLALVIHCRAHTHKQGHTHAHTPTHANLVGERICVKSEYKLYEYGIF